MAFYNVPALWDIQYTSKTKNIICVSWKICMGLKKILKKKYFVNIIVLFIYLFIWFFSAYLKVLLETGKIFSARSLTPSLQPQFGRKWKELTSDSPGRRNNKRVSCSDIKINSGSWSLTWLICVDWSLRFNSPSGTTARNCSSIHKIC